MNRRQSLVALSAVTTHALFPEVQRRFARAAAQPWQPVCVSLVQGERLAEVVETIVPTTDTPGAKAALVHVFVDLALAHCSSPVDQARARDALDLLGPGFAAATADERERRLGALDPAAFALLKDLTLVGYFTSRVGATKALAYDGDPGGYHGCLPLRPGQKAWAT